MGNQMQARPDNPFHAKIGEICKRVMREEVTEIIETKMVKLVEETIDTLLASKLAPTIEAVIEKSTPAIVAAELHNMLDGGEQRKLAPGGRISNGAGNVKKSNRHGNKGTKQPRKRCEKCQGCMRQQPPNSGEYECRKCDAGGVTA